MQQCDQKTYSHHTYEHLVLTSQGHSKLCRLVQFASTSYQLLHKYWKKREKCKFFYEVFLELNIAYVGSSILLWSLGVHSKWVPGTLNDVINIVTHRSKNTVPDNAKNLRNNTILELKFHIRYKKKPNLLLKMFTCVDAPPKHKSICKTIMCL
jgi:hypothetical protein